MEQVDQDILDGLTDEERAGLLESDGRGEGEDGGEDEGLSAVEQEALDVAAALAAKALPDTADDDAAALAAAELAKAADLPLVVEPVVNRVRMAPDDADEQLKTLAESKKAVMELLSDGEITDAEFQSQYDALNEKVNAINTDRRIDEYTKKQEAERVQNKANEEVANFLSSIGVTTDPGDMRYAAMDRAVAHVANLPTSAAFSVVQIMEAAHQLLVDQGLMPGKTATITVPPTKKAAKPAIPVTLATIPAAAVNEPSDADKFAHLDRLGPDERDAALVKMSDADRDHYLRYA